MSENSTLSSNLTLGTKSHSTTPTLPPNLPSHAPPLSALAPTRDPQRGMMPRNSEAVSQFKITTKRSTDRTLYRKTSIRFREISNYGTDSSLRGGMAGTSG